MTSPSPIEPVETPIPKRKRRRGVVFGVLAVVVVLVVVGVIALDAVARGYAANMIETKVRSSLSLPASTPVIVSVAGTSVLLQLATGRLERVDVAVDKLAIGQLNGDAKLTVTGVPIDAGKPIDTARLAFAIDQSQLQKLLGGLSALPVSSLVIGSGAVQVSTKFTVFGATVPFAIELVPSAVDGQLVLTPKSLTFNGKTLTPTDIGTSFGSLGDTLLATRKICVANLLPKGFVLGSVSVNGATLQLTVTAQSVLLDGALLTTRGVCP